MHRYVLFFVLALSAALLAACGSTGEDRAAVASSYADIAFASYEDAYAAAVDLDAAIDALVAEPSEATMQAARDAWRAAREPYGQTEAYRFADGPIDAADGPESLLNAWPLDEAYVDYVEGDPDAGIINRPGDYPVIDADLLVELNERGGEENVASGYHAIEFLLWGQDLSEAGAGARPASDFTTAPHAQRRAQYLTVASDLLLRHLGTLVEAWDLAGASNYRTTFLALDADRVLRNMITGIATLAESELAVDRMFVAVNNQDQEDEHSCFSDNTHRDIITNAQGVANVWRGRYERTDGTVVSGPSLADLVAEIDADVAAQVDTNLDDALAAVEAIPVPFDRAIIESEGAVIEAVGALQRLSASFVEAARVLDVPISTEHRD